ncbi:MAG TPA: DNA polymerase Y family protein, partial [Puia sp.]|nr:DNA polymerase Y family protein [Puia sp.]
TKDRLMGNRYCSLWFRHLLTDHLTIRRPALRERPFVLAAPDRGRKRIIAVNSAAMREGIQHGMVVADARVLCPALEVIDAQAGYAEKLLRALAIWCIRYTPVTAADGEDGLLLNISGCPHLWGSEEKYLDEICGRLKDKGYQVQGGIADTVGAAWAVARFGSQEILRGSQGTLQSGHAIIPPGAQSATLLPLSLVALRLDAATFDRLQRLGLRRIGQIAGMPRRALRRRFSSELLLRLDQAMGVAEENIEPVVPAEPFHERLPCLEPIVTATGIAIALQRLLDLMCKRLQDTGKGLRTAVFKGWRTDGKIIGVRIGTNRGSNNPGHLFTLFAEKLGDLEPDLGIELFTLEAPKVEAVAAHQKTLWTGACGLEDRRLSELSDRISNKLGAGLIHRYLPAEHYWPERSYKEAGTFDEAPASAWPKDRARPIHLLASPEPVVVAAPIPDYPPMHFRYRNKIHTVVKADGPERIEREWWMDGGEGSKHRDYYVVEDEQGARYWLFRSGHYAGGNGTQWWLHGFFP